MFYGGKVEKKKGDVTMAVPLIYVAVAGGRIAYSC